MALTDPSVRNAKHKAKPYKLADEKGMYLLIGAVGSKLWRYKYRFEGKEKLLSLGAYPEISLAKARERRDTARKLLADGVDPSENRRALKAAKSVVSANSFEVVAREWISKMAIKWVEKNTMRTVTRLEQDVFPWLGHFPITQITAPQLLEVLRRIESRGVIETARRIHQICGQIFRYAVATGRAERDVAADLKGALSPVVVNHHASITEPRAIGGLLRAIDGYEGTFITKCALKLAPLVFLRPGELRHAEWTEFDFDKAEWRLPANKMKMRAVHIVPLSKQAIAVIREVQKVTGSGRYVFPSVRTSDRPMSENTVNAALRRMGYAGDEMTGHGFRSMASTLLNEHGWNRDAIERQLAHGERDGVRAAYNYAEYMPERKRMMQEWANYLDKLKAGAEVVSFDRSGQTAA